MMNGIEVLSSTEVVAEFAYNSTAFSSPTCLAAEQISVDFFIFFLLLCLCYTYILSYNMLVCNWLLICLVVKYIKI
jgi:hypothetical protein